MKRVLTFLAIMLLPLSVMAMTPVSDSSLSDVTGQAGVNINADLQMNVLMGTMAWGDSTGVDATANGVLYGWTSVGMGAGGYVGINNFNITGLRIKARETDHFGTGYLVTTVYTASSDLKPITIDVATGGAHGAGVSFVRFGLGSLEIRMDSLSLEVGLGDRVGGVALDQLLGTVNMGAMAVYINPGSYVDIYNANGAAAGGQGVNMFFHVIVDHFDLGYVSWGDADGVTNTGAHGGVLPWIGTIAGTYGAGYIGLANLSVGAPITINGSVRIDVVTSSSGIYAHGFPTGTAVSVVHISFGDNFTISTGSIAANVNISSDGTLGVGTTPSYVGTLGDIYISSFTLQIDNGSWVDIWAH